MFEVDVLRVGDALAALVAAVNPDRLEGAIASDLFAGLDRIERLAATVADQQAGAGGGGRTGTGGWLAAAAQAPAPPVTRWLPAGPCPPCRCWPRRCGPARSPLPRPA
jgi:hypothetical protein